MALISPDQARRLAEDHFPRGPENLAIKMGVTLRYSPLSGTDGWCIHRDGRSPIIRISTNAPATRQRFTLAHELAHLLLGTDPEIVGETAMPFRSSGREERAADSLASELLIPCRQLRQLVRELPVDSKTVKDLAKKSGVSDMVAAARIVNEAIALGLINAGMAAFRAGVVQWCWSPTLRDIRIKAEMVYPSAENAYPGVYRSESTTNGQILTATVVGSPEYRVLLVQVLPEATAVAETYHERTRELGESLFAGDHSFRQSLNGCLGKFKVTAESVGLDDAVELFIKRYEKGREERLVKLRSEAGQAYLRHYLSRWTK